ncbi:MAG: glutathione S-transferase family protein [Rickettsiales bacterium]|jgi:glutathione S-transferase|nr:glutathione S-transferase family protein [Rickettsiales bacterium]
MRQLYHTALSPFCRKIRLMLKEKSLEFELINENPWDRKLDLFALSPAADLPILVEDNGFALSGAYAISEYLEENYPGICLLGRNAAERAEVRRLVDWFDHKFDHEVTQNILFEKAFKHYFGQGAPNSAAIRQGQHNLLYHLDYIGYLAGERYFLAGDTLTLADLAAAAHLSAIDYTGDVPWDYNKTAHSWYALVKSRPSMRCILTERVPGVRPPVYYEDPDF